MNARDIVEVLIDPEEFLSSVPKQVWQTFHIIRDGEHGVRASFGFYGHYLVYRNDENSNTRTFIGYINQGDGRKFYPTGVRRASGTTDSLRWETAEPLGSSDKVEAAENLSVLYDELNYGGGPSR